LRSRGALPFAIVRRTVFLAVSIAALAGCGGSQTRENGLRPPSPVTLTGVIHADGIQVSPARVGAGTVVLVVSNQSRTPQTVTFETDELGGAPGGTKASSPEIAPASTGRLTIKTREGLYSVHTADEAIRPARVKIGPPRKSSQDDLLLP
jgi:hypothetical protein